MSLGAELLHSVLGDWVEYSLRQFNCRVWILSVRTRETD